ncbi:hypothetical protein J6590_092586, partial [Homalodisca vitripennis]
MLLRRDCSRLGAIELLWTPSDSANWTTLSRLGVDRRRDSALAQRYVSEAIKWSRDKYVEHITGVK